MTDQKKQTNGRAGVNPAAAAIAGAVIGAGAAVVGAYALKDEKNRKKVKEFLTKVKDQAMDMIEEMQKTVKTETAKKLEGKKK